VNWKTPLVASGSIVGLIGLFDGERPLLAEHHP